MSREKSLEELDEEAEELSRQWETSREKACLVEQVKGVLLSQKSICIDNALCLGLGSIQVATPKLVLPEGFELASSEDQDLLQLEEDRETSPPVPKWQDQNKSLYQLLIFETALSCLRKSRECHLYLTYSTVLTWSRGEIYNHERPLPRSPVYRSRQGISQQERPHSIGLESKDPIG